ncbi:hypothetical protein C1752_03854 [Acaryochloris thomasi RCC1774]|uniref:Uncharacterized protein n=1 Tax=Acaryochloris thomasi RCC1774 TaxID=1764569 RepID=A0A2W1JUR6_9CYAN|nr:hypothetical protein [Acaryochloris thomasi]PZD72267.1 hypothetical protein C1752_03854 [Acaryochloris thomasi RCC1774]
MLDAQRSELERFNFEIVKDEPETLIALRQKWYPDCLLTKMTYVVFVRKVQHLSVDMMEADREQLQANAKQLNPSLLPRGFQAGVAVITIYIAERVDFEAQSLCKRKPKIRFAWFYLPAALEQSSSKVFYLKETPIWGFLYYGKFRYLIRRLLQPTDAPVQEPKSVVGVVFGLVLVGYLLLLAVLVLALSLT